MGLLPASGRGGSVPRILDGISEPADLKGLSLPALRQLASEIRDELIDTVMENGGHLASNLGVVELAISLHRVFDSPRDKIVWDVGHQAYVHKMLTGRIGSFSTIRQAGGLSGFPERGESPHDAFGTGHASTSISAALGMSVARELAGEDYHVIAVIGDGSMTGGMAFEAINHAGNLGKRLIVVLNDNAMAISPSVGALASMLNRLRLDYRYLWAKEEAQHVITRLPLGKVLWRAFRRAKMSLKGMLMPSMIWEEFGFNYMGPVDGHDIEELLATLRQARKYEHGPVLVHAITKKGKGYRPAEKDAIGFHGVPPNGGHKSPDFIGAPSYTEVFGDSALRIMRDNPRVVAITAAMADSTGLSTVANEFPGRVFDVGICEQHAVTFAAGLASQGLIPIVAIYSTFLQRAFDQIVHDVCLQNLPVVFALDRSGIVGEDGKTHQGAFDLSYLGCIPNMVVASPRDENELQHLLYTAVNANRPMAIRFPRGKGLGVPLDRTLKELPIGHGEVLREGNDAAIVAIGSTVVAAMQAAEELDRGNVQAAVINARYAKPLDSALISRAASEARRLVTVEENALSGGFGAAVLALLQEEGLNDVAVECLGLPDKFVEHGPQDFLRAKHGLDAAGIARRVVAAFPASISSGSLAGARSEG
ncbi:MAG: 1-deoxy-D-xylulose-5-phosphate synthase [Chloroflexi bacterium]|nr:1-deoxy-D-xylulose-5-phosphate synthase [Chloroflexota bacterium]